jgi:hypothetical protein
MPARVRDARVDIYRPTSAITAPDVKIPKEDIERYNRTETFQARPGDGEVVIDNGDFGTEGKYNNKALNGYRYEIDVGDRVEIRALTEYNSSSTTLDDDAALQFTGFLADVTAEVNGSGNFLTLSLEDFVFGVLKRRTVTGRFKNVLAAGAPDRIVDRIVANNAPELGLETEATPQELSITFKHDNLLEALRIIAKRSNSVMKSKGQTLDYDYIVQTPPDYTLSAEDFLLPIENVKSDEELINKWYVTGGEGEEIEVDTADQPDFATLKSDSPLAQTSTGVALEIADIPRIDLYTVKNNNPQSALRLRVQPADSNGNPVDPFSPRKDLGAAEVAYQDVVDSGFTPFPVDIEGADPDNGLALIAEWVDTSKTQGSYDVRCDIDSNGFIPIFDATYYRAYPIVTISEESKSQDAYRLQEGRIRADRADREEADSIAQYNLEGSIPPRETITFEADSQITHQAKPLETFTLEVPAARIEGQYGIKQVTQEHENNLLTTNIEAFNFESL